MSDQINSPTKMKLSLFHKIESTSVFVLDSNNIHLEINATTISPEQPLSPLHLYLVHKASQSRIPAASYNEWKKYI